MIAGIVDVVYCCGFRERTPMSFPYVFTYMVMAVIFVLPRYEGQTWAWTEYVALTVFLAVLAWLLTRRSSLESTNGHEKTSDLIAFRLGKALNRVRSRLRG